MEGDFCFSMRTFKIFFNALKSLSFAKLVKLLKLLLPHPLFAVLSVYATVKAFTFAQKQYPETASTNGKGNAFRHSYWCCLILMYCCKVSSPEKALEFCKRMTDMHEELFPNEPLETKMDLHNNEVGMQFFMEMLSGIHRQFFEKNFFVKGLKEKTKKAQILSEVNQDFDSKTLIYLEE